MATSTGKAIALIVVVLLILIFALKTTPFLIAPFGVFTGAVRSFGNSVHGINIWPLGWNYRHISFLSFVFLIIWIAVIVWVYRDAERRGMNGVLWALLVFIGNVIGLLIYLIVRNDSSERPEDKPGAPARSCPSCGKPLAEDFTFCPGCGFRLTGHTCDGCGKPMEPDWIVCPHCGREQAGKKS